MKDLNKSSASPCTLTSFFWYKFKFVKINLERNEGNQIERIKEIRQEKGGKNSKKQSWKEQNKSSSVCELAKRDFLPLRKNQTPGRKQTVFRKLILC